MLDLECVGWTLAALSCRAGSNDSAEWRPAKLAPVSSETELVVGVSNAVTGVEAVDVGLGAVCGLVPAVSFNEASTTFGVSMLTAVCVGVVSAMKHSCSGRICLLLCVMLAFDVGAVENVLIDFAAADPLSSSTSRISSAKQSLSAFL